MLRSIGKGIIGSRDEELSRTDLPDWTEGGLYFVPSNGGKAVGWIHNTCSKLTGSQEDTSATEEPKGHVELIVGKIPSDKVDDDISESWPTWACLLIQQCRRALQRLAESKAEEAPLFYKYDDDDEHTSKLKAALSQAMQPSVTEEEPAPANTDTTGSQ
jgi:hypothetical protein